MTELVHIIGVSISEQKYGILFKIALDFSF
jgi:hypothetical protein